VGEERSGIERRKPSVVPPRQVGDEQVAVEVGITTSAHPVGEAGTEQAFDRTPLVFASNPPAHGGDPGLAVLERSVDCVVVRLDDASCSIVVGIGKEDGNALRCCQDQVVGAHGSSR